MTIFNDAVENVLHHEGGYVNNPNDSGGETNFGITESVARKNGYMGDMREMKRSYAISIYKSLYWDSLELDIVEQSSPAIADKLFDIGVNMGVGRAAEFFQRLLNVLNKRQELYTDIAVDRDIGKQTLNAFYSYIQHRGNHGEVVMMKALNCLQGAFYITLSERREKDETFTYGWLLNRIN
jgi:lysozyme family protein